MGCGTARIAGTSSIGENKRGYFISLENQVLEIDAISGAKVGSLSIDGYNFLTDSLVHKNYWGSSFWISPEAVWNSSERDFDAKPYMGRIENGKVILTSPESVKTGLTVTKAFWGNKRNNSFVIEYTIMNGSGEAKDLAPWEVTRVHTDGIAFFPFGEGKRRGGLIPFTVEKEGISWYKYRSQDVPLKGDRQLYSDGSEGWLAQVNEQIVLIQKFNDIPFEKNAPEEGEVEWYASPATPGKSYVEIEHQGAYTKLQPGQSLTWKSEWYLRKLPANIKPEVGNAELDEYVRKVVR
jgi:hypothetical protein